MSLDNSIARSGHEPEPQAERVGFEIPPELSARYEVRVVEPSTGGERRIGLFRAGDGDTPAIEIADNRIVARSGDAETIASLVKIAQHNGWDQIEVEGAPAFRRAVWSAASREGLVVSGYEPTFAEVERMEGLSREASTRREREAVESAIPAAQGDGAAASIPAQSADAMVGEVAEDRSAGGGGAEVSDADRRLLLTLSRHIEDRRTLFENLDENRDSFQREVHFERIEVNREALQRALERALESSTLVEAFGRSGYEPDALRQMGNGGAWDKEAADAIYLVRSGLNRTSLGTGADVAATLADEMEADREDRSVAESTVPVDGRRVETEPQLVRAEQEREAVSERRHEREDLAELFLHGEAERVAAEPRLANALQAQTTMQQHIGEVFDGDASGMASANLEARQMISDVLRRGLDVSVREQTPVRQIEPIQSYHDLER